VGAASASSSWATSLTIAKPSGASAGHVLLASLDVRLDWWRSITPPAGWTLVRRESNQGVGATLSQAVYYHVVQSSEPASYTWRWPIERSSAGGILAYAGVDTARPVDASSGRFTSSSSRIPAPSVSTSSVNDRVIGFYGSNTTAGITSPSGTGERFDRAGSPSVDAAGADFVQSTAGATGDKVATLAQSDSSNIGQLVALRPTADRIGPTPAPAPAPAPDFTLSLSSASLSAQPGGSASTTVTTTALDGFSGSVALSASGLPGAATATFVPATVAGSGTSKLTISLSSAAVAGSYPVTVKATSGALAHTASFTLTVTTPSPSPDFALVVSPSSLGVQPGGTATATVATTALNGFSGGIAFAASGLPAGASASFAPTTIAGSGQAIATLNLGASVATGSYHVTITATSGSISHSAPISLTVAAPSPGLGAMLPARLPASTGQAFYVSTSGSDSNPGTLSAPWRTVQKAMNTLQPGQIAYVRAGTYSQNLLMKRAGTPSAPITIRNYPGERPVLHAGTSDSYGYPVLISSGAAYFRLSGFIIENAALDTIVNVWVSDHDEAQPYAAHDIEVSDNEIRNSVGTGMFVSPNTENVQILRNSIHNNGTGTAHQHQGVYVQGQDAVVANNLVYDNPHGFGIQVRGQETATAADNVLVVENTAVGNQLAGIVVENTASNTTVVNNISAFNGTSGIFGYYCCGPTLPGNVAYNNLLYGNGSGATSGSNVIDFSRGNLSADPRFRDRSADDFHLLSGSGAIDRALAPYSARDDYDGAARPAGAGPDVGGFEYR
jgi:hypothetical protein